MSDPEDLCTGNVVRWFTLRVGMTVDVDWPLGPFRGKIVERTNSGGIMPVFVLQPESEEDVPTVTVETGKHVTFHELPVVLDAA